MFNIKQVKNFAENNKSIIDTIKYEMSLLEKRRVVFSNEWDMEGCLKPYKIRNWSRTPNKDPEWIYMLNRFEYLNKSLVLYYVTLDKKYINLWNEFYLQWYKNFEIQSLNLAGNKNYYVTFIKRGLRKLGLDSKINLEYRTLDTAIRNYNLMLGINIINQDKNINLPNDTINSVIKECEKFNKFIYNNYIDFYDKSNWGIIIVSSYIITNLMMNKNYDEIKWALDKLIYQLEVQIGEFGAHYESSFLYHTQIVIFLLRTVHWLKKRNIDIPNIITEKLKLMMDFVYKISDKKNNIIAYGDSDVANTDTLLFISNVILDTNYNVNINNIKDAMLLFDIEFDFSYDIRISNTKYKKFHGDGYTILNGKDQLLISNTKPKSGHKHGDYGSFTYGIEGVPFFVDSGRYTYKNNFIRRKLRGPFAHNNLILDFGGYIKYKKQWEILQHPEELKNDIIYEDDSISIILVKYVAKKANFIRCFFYNKEKGDLIIFDKITKKGIHLFNEVLILDKECSVENSNYICNKNLKIKLDSNLDFKIKKCYISRRYNNLNKSNKIILRKLFKNEFFNIIVISKQNSVLTRENNAISCKINDENYIFYNNRVIITKNGLEKINISI